MTWVNFAFWLWITTLGIQCIYLLIFLAAAMHKDEKPSENPVPVSIIICARNEAKNLFDLIPKLLALNYPQYEIIVIDDCSSDNSAEIIKAYEERFDIVKGVYVPDNDFFYSGKKRSLTMGIKAASYEYLLFTDADCYPRSKDWIRHMASPFNNGKQISIGFGAYEKCSGLLNKLIRYDTFWTAVQYFSFAKTGRPYMGVGRNLAYTKSCFYRSKGFASHGQFESGDDDLFVNRAATRKNTAVMMAKNGHTISKPAKKWTHWFRQKRRHLYVAPRYRFLDVLMLGLWSLSYYLFIILFGLLIGSNAHVGLISMLFTGRYLLQISIFTGVANKLRSSDIIPFMPFLELALMCFYPIFATNNLFNKPIWKKK